MGDAQMRANYAGSIKRIAEYAKSAALASAEFENVDVRLKRLESVWKSFEAEHSIVLQNITDSDKNIQATNNEIFESAEMDYLSAQIQLTKRLNELKRIERETAAESEQPRANSTRVTTADMENIVVSLPNRPSSGLHLAPQKLPVFNGDYAAWPTFRDMFVRMVHHDETLYPLAKLNALEQHLSGEALRTI